MRVFASFIRNLLKGCLPTLEEHIACVAQPVEYFLGKEEVASSNLATGSFSSGFNAYNLLWQFQKEYTPRSFRKS